MINEKDNEEIRREARKILDNFVFALEKVGKVKGKSFKRELGGFREEGKGEKCDDDFRKRMFENAPNKEGDCIVAEKKKW